MTPDSLESLATSPAEIADLLERYAVALSDARVAQQSLDGRFADAYAAGFLLAKIAVRASGYRVKGGENHRDAFVVLPWVVGSAAQDFSDAMSAARRRRNRDLYDAAGVADASDVSALLTRVTDFEVLLRKWLEQQHPQLLT